MRGISPNTRLVVSILIVAVVLLSAFLVLSISPSTYVADKSPPPVRTTILTPHDPIYIDGNGGFNNVSGVVWGSGTAADPYIIADWDINASAANGISILNADAHFTVRNCHVFDGGLNYYYGIGFFRCANGTVENNDCSNNVAGIYLIFSGNSTLTGNKCWNNKDGINLTSSNGNKMSDNNCSSNYLAGIILFGSSNNNVSNNNCTDNLVGIDLYSNSRDNVISGNSCITNSWCGFYFYMSGANTVTLNLLRGNSLYGAYIYSGPIVIFNNTFIGNNGAESTYDSSHIQAYDSGFGNRWNSSDGYGNYWNDWTTPDIAPPFGIVDVPYDISGGTGSKDYYPLTTEPPTPIPEFGRMPLVVMVLLAAVFLMAGARRRTAL